MVAFGQKRKRTQAFSAPKDKRIKTIIKENAASPLLRLPLELRQNIWQDILGDRTIHIKFAPTHRWEGEPPARRPLCLKFRGKFTYIICEAPVSEEAAYASFTDNNVDTLLSTEAGQIDVRKCRDRHAKCYDCYDDCLVPLYSEYDENVGKPINPDQLAGNRVHLELLRVCRQTYIEANPVLWSSTLWSFTHSLAFTKFMEHRNAVQRRTMRKLHLDLDMRYAWKSHTWAYWWYASLHKSVLSKFSALDVVHLDITGNKWIRNSNIIGNPAMFRADLEFNMLSDLWHVAPKTLTVTCMETFNTDGSKMTVPERQKMANDIRIKLSPSSKAPDSAGYLTFSQHPILG